MQKKMYLNPFSYPVFLRISTSNMRDRSYRSRLGNICPGNWNIRVVLLGKSFVSMTTFTTNRRSSLYISIAYPSWIICWSESNLHINLKGSRERSNFVYAGGHFSRVVMDIYIVSEASKWHKTSKKHNHYLAMLIKYFESQCLNATHCC